MTKYIKKFELTSKYEEYINSDIALLPNISIIKDINGIHYNPIYDYSQDYLTFVAKEDGTFKFIGNSINYSVDDGKTWTTLSSNTDTPTVQAGNKIMFKATLIPQDSSGIGTFSSTSKFIAQGNVMSLLYGDDFIGQKDLTGKDYVFYDLFNSCTGLINAKNLCLPATTLTNNCYSGMFNGCTSLTIAPELPATTLANNCYSGMFNGCTNLNYIKMLATNIGATNCLNNWVSGVSSTGTFVKHPNMTSLPTGSSGIPTGWTAYTEDEYKHINNTGSSSISSISNEDIDTVWNNIFNNEK